MAYIYLIIALNWILGLLYLAVLLAPPVLWFLHRSTYEVKHVASRK